VSATWVILASYLHPVVHVTAILNKNFYCGNSSGEVSDMKISGEDLSIIHSRVCNAVVHRIVHAFYSYMRKTTLIQKF